MPRSVPQWIGKTDDAQAPPRVRLRVFNAFGGICQLTGRKIRPGDQWELDHIKALINGGKNEEDNLHPVLKEAHKDKTRADVAEKAKVDRIRKKHLGIKGQSSRGFQNGRNGKYKTKMNGQTVLRHD